MILVTFLLSWVAVAVYAIATAEFFVGQDTFETYRGAIALGLAGLGGGLLIYGFFFQTKSNKHSKLATLFDVRLWGFALGMMAGVTSWVRATNTAALVEQLRGGGMFVQSVSARTKSEADSGTNGQSGKGASKETPPPPPTVAPFKLQGVFFRQQKPVAMIDGELYEVGEAISEFIIREIHPSSVIAVRSNVTVTLSLKGKGETAERLRSVGK